MPIKLTLKEGKPWAPVLSRLAKFERAITAGESDAMEARWLFGRELLNHRKEYKGRQVIPADLMRLAMDQCGRSKADIKQRVRFADKFPTQKLMANAVSHYPSWRQMCVVGLVDQAKARTKQRKTTTNNHSAPWLLRRLSGEIDRALTQHASLTREQIKDVEGLVTKLQALLKQIDENDDAQTRAS